MSTIILSSSGIESKPIERECRKFIDENTKIALIPTARDNDKKEKSIQKHTELLKKLFNPKCVDVVDLEFDDAKALLKYDFIYLLGGTSFKLQYFCNKAKVKPIFEKLIERNITFFGISSGAMIFGEDLGVSQYLTPEKNIYGLTNFAGLNIVDINICPHYKSAASKKIENFEHKIKQYSKEQGFKLTKIRDGQAIVYNTETRKRKKLSGKVIEERRG